MSEYSGTVILVSHDRDFIDRTATVTLAWEEPGRWTVYAGGYTDAVRQGWRMREDAAPVPKKKAKAKVASPTKTAKLSFKHKHRLDVLPAEMDALETRIAELETTLAEPGLYSRDPERFNAQARALEAARAELDAGETEWLELEAMREAAEG